MNKKEIELAFQKALLFNVNTNTKFVCANVKDRKLQMIVGLDRKPTEDEKDMFFSVSAEVTGNFKELDDSKSEVRFLVDNASIDSIAKTNMVFYARCDYLDENGLLI